MEMRVVNSIRIGDYWTQCSVMCTRTTHKSSFSSGVYSNWRSHECDILVQIQIKRHLFPWCSNYVNREPFWISLVNMNLHRAEQSSLSTILPEHPKHYAKNLTLLIQRLSHASSFGVKTTHRLGYLLCRQTQVMKVSKFFLGSWHMYSSTKICVRCCALSFSLVSFTWLTRTNFPHPFKLIQLNTLQIEVYSDVISCLLATLTTGIQIPRRTRIPMNILHLVTKVLHTYKNNHVRTRMLSTKKGSSCQFFLLRKILSGSYKW